MDHVVYLDYKSQELEKILSWEKNMLIRGATWRKLPYWKVELWDILYFINNNAEGLIKAKATVSSIFNSEKMNENESKKLVNDNQNKLLLSNKQFQRFAWKRYIVLIEIKNIEEIKSFTIDKSNYWNMDDWLLVKKIENVK